MSDYVSRFSDHTFTCLTNAAVVGGQVLQVSASSAYPYTVGPTSAASNHVIGVAAHDAPSGANVTVERGGIQTVKATGSITYGTPVKSATAGTVTAWVSGTDDASLNIGTALTTVADQALVDVLWRA